MSEKDDSVKRFEEYLKEKEGQPIDQRAVEAGKRELELGKKGGFPVYGDEPDREKLIASYPQRKLSEKESEKEEEQELSTEKVVEQCDPETNLTERELEDAISELITAKKIIMSFVEEGKLKDGIIPDKLGLVMSKIVYKYGIHSTVNDFPSKIGELISKYNKALRRFKDL